MNKNVHQGLHVQVPRFLAVVTVPTAPHEYAVCTDDHMRLSNAAYWLSLAEQELEPVGEGSPGSVMVKVPERNLLTVASLDRLMVGDLEGAAQ